MEEGRGYLASWLLVKYLAFQLGVCFCHTASAISGVGDVGNVESVNKQMAGNACVRARACVCVRARVCMERVESGEYAFVVELNQEANDR